MLGNKMTQHNILQMGNKKNTGINYLGNKIDSQSRRHVLPMPSTPTVNRTSPIEKYRTINH
jgi:hypothetical protein